MLNFNFNLVLFSPDQIRDLPLLCRFGCKTANGQLVHDPEGCQEVVKFGQRESHERICPLAQLECPNSALCDKMQRRALSSHLEVCRRTPCLNKEAGCKFEGSKRDLERHLVQCQYRASSSKTMGEGSGSAAAPGDELVSVKQMVEDLTERMKSLEEQLVLSRQTTSGAVLFFLLSSFFFFSFSWKVFSFLSSPGSRS